MYIKCSVSRFFDRSVCLIQKYFILILKMSEEYQTAAWLHTLLVTLGLMG